MSKYFTPITELPGDSGKSQSASSMVQYKTVSNNKFEKKLAPNTKFVEPQKMFPESTNSPVSHSRKFSKRGNSIAKANLSNTLENMTRAAKTVGETRGGTSANFMDSFIRLFPDVTDQRQVVDELADALHDSSGKKKANIENILGDFLATNPLEINGKPANAADVVGIMFAELTRRTKDATTISDKRSALVRGTPFTGSIHPRDGDAPFERIFARPPALTGATSSSASPASSGIPGLPPASTSSSASTASSTPFTGLGSEKEIDVPHGVWNVGSHLKGVFGNIIPLATAPLTQIRRNRAQNASARNMEAAIENIMEDYPKLTKDQATRLANNFKSTEGKDNFIHVSGSSGAAIGAKSRAADELSSAFKAERRAQEFKERLEALKPRTSQFKRSAAALANDAAIIGGLGYAGYNLAFGDKNKNQSSPTPMQPTPMQPTPTTAFTPPAPMDLSQSKPLDKWKPVSDPSLMGKRMKKRGSVEKANFGDIATNSMRVARQLAEERRLASNLVDVADDLGTRRLTTIPPVTTKPSVTASSPFDATLADIYTTGPLDELPSMVRAAMPAIRSAASTAGSATGSGASRAAGAARRAGSATVGAIASSPPKIKRNVGRFVNAVGVLGGPGVQDFGRGVADVFDSSKGKWLDRMQNAYEDVRGIKRPWKTPTIDPIGGYEIPGAIKEPKYEVPYPNLDPLDPEYRWKSYANDVRQTATDPRRAWRRNRPWVLAGAGALGTGAYYGLNALNSRNQNPPQLQPDEEIRAATGAPAPILTPAPAPAPAPAPEPQTTAGGDLTTGDAYRDRLIRQKYENFVTFINEEGVLQPGKYKNSDAKGQIDPRQLAETSMLVYGLIKENLPKLSKSTDKEISEFFDGFVQSQITEMQYNKAVKQGGFTLPKSIAPGSYMPYLNDTQRAALSLPPSPTSIMHNTTDPKWYNPKTWPTTIDNTADPVEKSMGNKNKYGNDRSVIQKSMTSPVDKFSLTPKKNKYKDK